MDVEELDLGKLSFREKPSSTIPVLWTKKTAERAYDLYREHKKSEESLKSITPNRRSKFPSHNPLIRFEYLDPGYEGPKIIPDELESVERTDYVCSIDAASYHAVFNKKEFALPAKSVLQMNGRLFQTLLYVDVPNDEKSSTERFYEYVLNLMTLPMPLPVSPFHLFMTRPEYSKLYASSSFSICVLKKLYSLRALNCDTKIKTRAQLKIVNEDMVGNLGEEDEEYGKLIASFVERYDDCLAAFDTETEIDWTGGPVGLEIELEEKIPLVETICYEMVEAMYFHLIRIVNIIECACINLYVHDSHADAGLEHLAEIYGQDRLVTKKWDSLTTHNCLLSTKNLSFSRNSIEFRRSLFFDATTGFGYMFGKEGLKEWNDMCAVQCNYVKTMLREHMKIPGFREKYDERCNNVAYRYFSKKCRGYMSSYDENEEKRENDQTKLDIFCASSFACIEFLNICSAKMTLNA